MPVIKDDYDILDLTQSNKTLLSKVQEMCNDLAKESVAKQVLVGGATGWVVGFLSMKIGKTAATIIGGGLLLVQVASYQGYIQIDWRKVNKDLESNAKKLQKQVKNEISSTKAQKDSSRRERDIDRALATLEQQTDRASHWFKRRLNTSNTWLRRQYNTHVLHNNKETLQTLYHVNVYLVSFWAGSIIGMAAGTP